MSGPETSGVRRTRFASLYGRLKDAPEPSDASTHRPGPPEPPGWLAFVNAWAVQRAPAALFLAAALPTCVMPRSRLYRMAALLLACITAAKPPYAPLLVGLLFPRPPVRAWLQLRKPLLLRIAVIIVLLLPGPLWPGPRPAVFDGTSAAAQLTVLPAEPLRLLTLPGNAVIHDPILIRSAVGALGWRNVVLPDLLCTPWSLAIAAAPLCDLVARRGGAGQGSLAGLALGGAASFACVIGIDLSQRLAWTPVGHPELLGPSGRYLLPMLPLLALSFPLFAHRSGAHLRAGLTAVPVTAALAGAVVLPPSVVYALVPR